MRQKKLKYVNKDLLSSDDVVVDVNKINLNTKNAYLEIGSGKGLFITTLAQDYPDDTFIAMEVNINVCYRILEKKKALGLENLIIILGNAEDILHYFDPKSLDGIYLNFSDPWPKAKHHKRRLTAPSFIKNYVVILKDQAFVQFRTDHIELFDASIEYMHPYVSIEKIDYDLKASSYMTEYEIKKRRFGPIYQLNGKVEHDAQKNI